MRLLDRTLACLSNIDSLVAPRLISPRVLELDSEVKVSVARADPNKLHTVATPSAARNSCLLGLAGDCGCGVPVLLVGALGLLVVIVVVTVVVTAIGIVVGVGVVVAGVVDEVVGKGDDGPTVFGAVTLVTLESNFPSDLFDGIVLVGGGGRCGCSWKSISLADAWAVLSTEDATLLTSIISCIGL
jgi:hypothetical protein